MSPKQVLVLPAEIYKSAEPSRREVAYAKSKPFAKSKIQDPKPKIRNPRSQNPKSKIQNPNGRFLGCHMKNGYYDNPKSKIQNPRSKIQDPKSKIQDPKSKTQNPRSKNKNPRSKLQNPNGPTQACKQKVGGSIPPVPGSNWAPISRWWLLGFQPCVAEIGGQFPEKWWRVVVCQATILWVQLRERGQEKKIKLDAAAFCCHAR